MFVLLPFIGFFFGMAYQQKLTGTQVTSNPAQYPNPSPTPTPNRKFNTYISPLVTPLSELWSKGIKTYSSPKIAISFEYPQLLQTQEKDTKKENELALKQSPDYYKNKSLPYGSFYLSIITKEVPIEERQKEGFNFNYYDDNTMEIVISAFENPNNLSVIDFESQRFKNYLGVDGKTPYIDFLKGSSQTVAKPINGSLLSTGSGGGETPSKDIYFPYKQKIYQFTLRGGNNTGQEYSKDAEKIFDQVISSIKFN